jgi:putative transposase
LQPHRARPAFDRHVPVHVTMRAMRGVPKMRAQVVARVVYGELARASGDGFRLLDFSIQDDHVHLVAEADDGMKLARGMQRLASRIAMVVNALVRRHGRFWRERYHRRDLTTPRQFRNALVYVLFNFRKHASAVERKTRARQIDGLSSGAWLEGWASETFAEYVRQHRERAGPRPTVPAKTWIARVGWKRLGALDPRETPRLPG